MTAIPGAPQVQNIIPGNFFQTSTFAAPVLGIVGGTIIFILGMVWLEVRKKQLISAGEAFDDITILEKRYGRGADLGLSSGGTADDSPSGSSAPDNAGNAAESTSQVHTKTRTRCTDGEDEDIDYNDEGLPVAPTPTQQTLKPRNHFLPFIPLLLFV